MSSKCNRCDGCGLVSNRNANVPWTYFVENDSDQDSMEIDGLTHYPIACSLCGGLGTDRVKADTQAP